MEIISFKEAAKLLNALTEYEFIAEEIQKSAERIMNVERAYIVREGIRREDDSLPERFLKEPLPDECGESVGSVVELEPMLDEYYKARNWEVATGIPTEEKLRELGLEKIIVDLKERNII